VFAISPNFLLYMGESEGVLFVIGILEILRRSIWNFLRVEREHIFNCGDFNATDDFKLPFEDIRFDFDESLLFLGELQSVMNSDGRDAEGLKDKTKSFTPRMDKSKSVQNSLAKDLRKILLEKRKDAEWMKNLDLESILENEYDFEEIINSVKTFKKTIIEKANDFAIHYHGK
jgi:EXS family